jgi:hypothetical protein
MTISKLSPDATAQNKYSKLILQLFQLWTDKDCLGGFKRPKYLIIISNKARNP